MAGYWMQRWWAAFAAFCNARASAPWHALDAQWRVRSAAAAASDAARPPPPSPSIALLPARVAMWTWIVLLVLLLHATWRRRALGKARREEDELRAALEAELAAVRGGLADDLASEVLARLVAPQYEEEVPYDDEGNAEFGNGHVGGDAKATAAAIMAEAEARARAK